MWPRSSALWGCSLLVELPKLLDRAKKSVQEAKFGDNIQVGSGSPTVRGGAGSHRLLTDVIAR